MPSALIISTLDLFQPYDVGMAVGEHWQPQPNTSPDQLGAHLAEFTAREFAHSNALNVAVLRLGHVVMSEEVAGQAYDPMWLDQRDAAHAVDLLLKKQETLDPRRARSLSRPAPAVGIRSSSFFLGAHLQSTRIPAPVFL